MELRVLRYFLAVAEEGNITSAAKYLHITQPTLSRQIMELEEEIGKKLIIRGKRKLTLTDEGILLKKRAEEIINLVDKTEKELSENDEIISGDVYIGAGETEAMRILAKVMKSISATIPL